MRLDRRIGRESIARRWRNGRGKEVGERALGCRRWVVGRYRGYGDSLLLVWRFATQGWSVVAEMVVAIRIAA